MASLTYCVVFHRHEQENGGLCQDNIFKGSVLALTLHIWVLRASTGYIISL